MRFIKNFKLYDNFEWDIEENINEPDNNEVKEILNFLNNKYDVKEDKILDYDIKYLIVNYKTLYLSEPFLNKKRVKYKIYMDIINDLSGKYKNSSIMRAIKDFINKNIG